MIREKLDESATEEIRKKQVGGTDGGGQAGAVMGLGVSCPR